jgi:hypothetical protein
MAKNGMGEGIGLISLDFDTYNCRFVVKIHCRAVLEWWVKVVWTLNPSAHLNRMIYMLYSARARFLRKTAVQLAKESFASGILHVSWST